jgi:Zn-dependent protease
MKRFFQGNVMVLILFLVLIMRAVSSGELFSHPLQWLIGMLVLLPGIVIGITIHEWAHAFAAYKLGDMTPKLQGRVTLNPAKHIDPMGFVALLLIGFGWGRPVEVNPYAFRHRRRDNLITDIAGIFTNFVFAFVFMGILRLLNDFAPDFLYIHFAGEYYMYSIFMLAVQMNLVLMIFNLLPVPPLDGFGVVTEIFNLRGKPIYNTIYNMGFPILILLIIFNIPSKVISPVISFLFDFIWGVFF